MRATLTAADRDTLALVAEVFRTTYVSSIGLLTSIADGMIYGRFLITGVGAPEAGQWYIDSRGSAKVCRQGNKRTAMIRILLERVHEK